MPATPTTSHLPTAEVIAEARSLGMVFDYTAECFVPESAIADYDAHLAEHAERLYAEACANDLGLRIADRIRNGR